MKRKLSQRRRANDVVIWTRKKGGSEGGGVYLLHMGGRVHLKAMIIILIRIQTEDFRKAVRSKIVDN